MIHLRLQDCLASSMLQTELQSDVGVYFLQADPTAAALLQAADCSPGEETSNRMHSMQGNGMGSFWLCRTRRCQCS
jgi:hypothetical protein